MLTHVGHALSSPDLFRHHCSHASFWHATQTTSAPRSSQHIVAVLTTCAEHCFGFDLVPGLLRTLLPLRVRVSGEDWQPRSVCSLHWFNCCSRSAAHFCTRGNSKRGLQPTCYAGRDQRRRKSTNDIAKLSKKGGSVIKVLSDSRRHCEMIGGERFGNRHAPANRADCLSNHDCCGG